jgi:hypothetical protein
MTGGFDNKKINNGEATVIINDDEVSKLLKKYKKIKKYMKSPLYTVKIMDGTEEIVNSLLKETEENPID